MVYYNENDPFAAAWLRQLIAAGLIAKGDVDERSIEDVMPQDVGGYTQCHFFAGIGGWSYALRLAGWPDSRPVWTGSCPCQPFSSAGKRKGITDERHLWPSWFHLINQCRPNRIFGEQVEAAVRQGWFDLVSADLEGIGYTVGAGSLPAAGVGAPHIRQRAWFVADSYGGVERNGYLQSSREYRLFEEVCGIDELADSSSIRRVERRPAASTPLQRDGPERTGKHAGSEQARELSRGFEGLCWNDCDWLPCRDGKSRPVEPGTFPLAHGVSSRVGKLRGYGNAIVPQVAAAFIEAYLDSGWVER